MEVFHKGDKVFLDNMKHKCYKKIDIDVEGNQQVELINTNSIVKKNCFTGNGRKR